MPGTSGGCTAGGCTAGTLYSSAISVASTETVQAVGALSGYNNSPASSAPYTITAFTSPTYNATCNNTESATPSTSVSCTATPTAGDLAFVYCRTVSSGLPSYTASSSPSSSFSSITGSYATNGSAQSFYAFGLTGGSTTFTCTTTSNPYQGIQVLLYHPGSVTALATASMNGQTAASATYTSNTASTTGAAFYIVCADAQFLSTSFTTPIIGSLTATARTFSLGSSVLAACMDAPASTNQSSIAGSLVGSTSGTWAGVIAAFH